MATFTKTNGTVGPAGEFISFIGKKPLALGVRIADGGGAKDLSAELGPEGAVAGIFQAITANTTIMGYQIESGNGGAFSIILDGAASLSAADVQAIIRTSGSSGSYNGVAATSSLVTNLGLKLATS